ncbi:MAG: NUDIX domain-containing protein [Chlorobi bacterium]|nr:NUDIX domain-containing protein [Chlorobiota bacterium]
MSNKTSRTELFKRMIPGFIPVIAFIVADEVWGTFYGLIVAIVIGVTELVYSLMKYRTIDRFVLLDIGLLLALGGISLVFDNDIFFKVKPGIINLIITGLIGYSAFSKNNIVLMMSKRYMKGVEFNPYQMWLLNESMSRLFWILLVYSVMTIIAAFVPQKLVWDFMAGPGMFVVFGVFMGVEWIIKKRQNEKYKNEEWVPLVDEDGNVTGQAPRSVVHNGKSMLLHPVVHLQVIGSKGIFLQKRPLTKNIQPGKWDTAVGGHVDPGENIEQALGREAMEEIGIRSFNATLLKKYVWESGVERELVFSFITNYEGQFKIDSKEVASARFWRQEEIDENIDKDLFTPNFVYEYKWVREVLSKF